MRLLTLSASVNIIPFPVVHTINDLKIESIVTTP